MFLLLLFCIFIWYAIGVASMIGFRIYMMPSISNAEIFVLGAAGPFVTLRAIYCWFAPKKVEK